MKKIAFALLIAVAVLVLFASCSEMWVYMEPVDGIIMYQAGSGGGDNYSSSVGAPFRSGATVKTILRRFKRDYVFGTDYETAVKPTSDRIRCYADSDCQTALSLDDSVYDGMVVYVGVE